MDRAINAESVDDIKTLFPDHTKPDARVGVDFLLDIAADRPVTVVTIHDGSDDQMGEAESRDVIARSFSMIDTEQIAAMRSFIGASEQLHRQVYYAVNVASDSCRGVPRREDIAFIRAIVLDFDPARELPLAQERDRLRQLAFTLINGPKPPHAIVDTGGGMQVIWALEEPVALEPGMAEEIETLMRALARTYGADSATCTVKQLFRVPGTNNWPTPSKARAGRVRTVSGLWHTGGPACTIADLQALATVPIEDAQLGPDIDFDGLIESDVVAVFQQPNALPKDLVLTLKSNQLLQDIVSKPSIFSADRSGDDMALCFALARNGLRASSIALLLSAYGAKVREMHDRTAPGSLMRYVVNTVKKALRDTAPERFFQVFQDPVAEEIKPKGRSLTPLTVAEMLTRLEAADDESAVIVKGLLGRREMAVIYGQSGTGKTFVTLDLLYHIAQGKPWNGHRTVATGVVYIAAESPLGSMRRIKALADAHGISPNFYIIPATVNLLDANADLVRLIQEITALKTDIGVIAIDTLARTMTGGNENSTMDMSKLVFNSDILRDRFNACILWVHHAGKNVSLGARGSSALVSATDTELEIADHTLTSTKTRDRDEIAYKFALRKVVIGVDSDGTPSDTCLVTWLGEPAKKRMENQSPQSILVNQVMTIMREVSKPDQWMTIEEIGSWGRDRMGLKLGTNKVLRQALDRSCESDVENFILRRPHKTVRKNAIIYEYTLAIW